MPETLSYAQLRIIYSVYSHRVIKELRKAGYAKEFFEPRGDGIMITLIATIDNEQHVSRMLMRPEMSMSDVKEACDDLISALSNSASVAEEHRNS